MPLSRNTVFPWRFTRNSVGELRVKRLHYYDDRRISKLSFKLPFSHRKQQQQQQQQRKRQQSREVVWWLQH